MLIAFDTETYLMSTGNVIPKPVCLQFSSRNDQGDVETEVLLRDDPRACGILRGALESSDYHLTGANIAFDMTVVCNQWPELIPLVFDAYEDERIHDIQLMDKLLCISTTGKLDFYPLPSGGMGKLSFSQAAMEERWLGVDRSADKKGEDVWRLRYSELDNIPVSEWPEDALRYAREDTIGALLLHEHIIDKATESGHGSICTEGLHAAVGFCLRLGTACWLVSRGRL